MKSQSTNTILMVRPADFEFNAQTAADNEFQNMLPGRDVRQEAMSEFENAVTLLRAEGVQVLVLEKDSRLPEMPDAVFPNNWFGTDDNGAIHIFPMKTPNRQRETEQISDVLSLLENEGFSSTEILDWRKLLGENQVLEGTGSLILDRVHKRMFAAISERTQEEACRKFAAETGYQPVLFHTMSSRGFAYYHTNVVMSIGANVVVACLDCIPDSQEREMVRNEIIKHHALVEISIQQLEEGFCGNLLQVLGKGGETITVLSSTAYNSLSDEQKETLSKHGKLIPIPIPVIEAVGGGSIRCMMAEIFCPRKTG